MSYPQQLPPELLAQLAALGMNKTMDYGGMTYMPLGLEQNNEGGQSYTPQGYAAFTQGTALKPGAQGVEYGLNGNGYSGYRIQDGGAPDKQMLMAALAFAGGVGALGGFGGAFAGADAGAIDPSLAVQGNSINALDAATGVPYGSEAVGSGAGGGLAGSASGSGAFTSALGGSGAADPAMTSGGLVGPASSNSAFNSALADAGGGAGGVSSWLSSMGLSPSMLGVGASLLGGLLGSKPQQSTVNQTRDIPSWLKPYVTGQGGLLDSAQQTFAAQKNSPVPGALQNAGLGLLAQPVAPNGFSRFFPGH